MSLPQLLNALNAPASVIDDAKTAEAQSAEAERAAERKSALDAFSFIKLNDKVFVVPKSAASSEKSKNFNDLKAWFLSHKELDMVTRGALGALTKQPQTEEEEEDDEEDDDKSASDE